MTTSATSRPKKVRYLTKVSKIDDLKDSEKDSLKEVEEKFVFRSNDYYNSLIDWDDPSDPIKKIVIPQVEELSEWGSLDASSEHKYTVANGLEHKYKDTALILFNDMCGAYCRFCFRKRLFIKGNDDTVRDLEGAIEYIKEHKEINNVLITGGDPLVASTSKIEPLIKKIREIDHVNIIRIGSKMFSFNPYRILEDPSFVEMISKYSLPEKKIYIMNHFNHPRELTEQAIKAINLAMKAGAIVINQTPMIKGVNDNVATLKELFEKLSFIGVPPYYVFGCRPTEGNKAYTVPVEEAFAMFEEARTSVSGLAARARYSMSHESGKIEVLGMTKNHIMFRYHRAANPKNRGRTLVCKRNQDAYWFDDYTEIEEEF